MNNREQIVHFENQLNAVISRFIDEYDLSLGEAIGVIEIVKLHLYKRHTDGSDEEGD